jgi:hypothetical protein
MLEITHTLPPFIANFVENCGKIKTNHRNIIAIKPELTIRCMIANITKEI